MAHKRDYHPPGYKPPCRDNTDMLAGHLPRDVVANFKDTAAEHGKTITAALQEAARDFILKHTVGGRRAAARPR
jgi:hypothetical protein